MDVSMPVVAQQTLRIFHNASVLQKDAESSQNFVCCTFRTLAHSGFRGTSLQSDCTAEELMHPPTPNAIDSPFSVHSFTRRHAQSLPFQTSRTWADTAAETAAPCRTDLHAPWASERSHTAPPSLSFCLQRTCRAQNLRH